MKTTSLFVSSLAAAVLALPLPSFADDAHHPDQAGKPALTRAKAPAPEQTVKKMQGNATKMQAQLDRLGKAKNEAEFQKIMAEHMLTMQENMQMATGMAGMDCGMMGARGMQGMTGGGMMADHEAMMKRMEQMETRMDMMEQRTKPPTP